MCHVLIIEDEAMIAIDLEALLEREGASSFSFAATQAEAVIAAQAHRPDVITSDVTLLEGTGPAAVALIRAVLGDVPVVYISATAKGCCTEDRMTRTLTKPLDRPAVVTVFRELCHLNRA
ncbi:response regulator [uncultured Sphingomonas sp.]|uniref:response regulator n=1 Tax=uncultured Sphingomonas sp. TaxID=158754 RepID=UPI0035C97BBD